MKDWIAWHEAYDDPTSSLARRLQVVRRRLAEVLERAGPRPRLLSLCAGDGRDVVPVLATRAGPSTVAAVLVEKDQVLADRARQWALAAGLDALQVRCGDAGDPSSFADVLPVDVLLLCGIFGNIEHAAIRDVIRAVPRLVVPGGYVIWTRGGSDPDRRPEVRAWFEEAGLPEVAFDGAPEPYGVGVNRLPLGSVSEVRPLPERLFAFL